MKRFLLLLTLLISSQLVSAQEYTCSTKTANVRTAPDPSAKVVGTLKQNQRIEVKTMNGDWAEISYRGRPSYVLASKLKLATTKTAKKTNAEKTKDVSHSLNQLTQQLPTIGKQMWLAISAGILVLIGLVVWLKKRSKRSHKPNTVSKASGGQSSDVFEENEAESTEGEQEGYKH